MIELGKHYQLKSEIIVSRPLVNLGFITQEVSDLYQHPLDIFLSDIAPKIASTEFYPEEKKIFRALNECPEPKVVILGQD